MYDTFHANIEEADPIAAYTQTREAHRPRPHLRERSRRARPRPHPVGGDLRGDQEACGYDGWLTIEAFGRGAERPRRRDDASGATSPRAPKRSIATVSGTSGTAGGRRLQREAMMEAATTTMSGIDIGRLIEAVADTITPSPSELTALDQAIGDGDHGAQHEARLRGGAAPMSTTLAAKPLPEALKAVGMTAGDEGRRRVRPALRHAVHDARQGAAGRARPRGLADAFGKAIDAVKARGKSRGRPEDDARRARVRCATALGRRRRPPRSSRVADAAAEATDADEGDPRPRLVPRRPLDRPHGSGRALERADRRAQSPNRLGAGA